MQEKPFQDRGNRGNDAKKEWIYYTESFISE